MSEHITGLQHFQKLQDHQNSHKPQIYESDQNYSESNFSTNKEHNLMKEMEYLD
jgi:hypothetical protein